MFRMTVADVFVIRGRGAVATGTVEAGTLRVGDEVQINGAGAIRVDAIEAFRKKLDAANAGDNVGLLFKKLDKGDVQAGDVISTAGAEAPRFAHAAGAAPRRAARAAAGDARCGADDRRAGRGGAAR